MARRRINKGRLATLISSIILVLCLAGMFFAVPKMKEEKEIKTTASSNLDEVSENKKQDSKKTDSVPQTNSSNNTENVNVAVKGEVDNWAGWFALFGANLGNETKSDSYFGASGLDVTITPVDSDEEKLQHLINGDIDFTACTINRLALISGELAGANTSVVVPLFTDSSNGGDAIVAKSQFNSIESLKDATIGVGEGSVSHSVIAWAVQQTDMSQAEKEQIINNIKTYPSASDAKDAYLRGEINAIATWQPYVDELINNGGSNIILSTKISSTLVMDALFFRKDFADAHPEIVEEIVDGVLSVVEDMKNQKDTSKYCEAFRNSLPDFNGVSDAEILSMLEESKLLDWHSNIEAFDNTAKSMFYDMCSVWDSIGHETYVAYGDNIFDDSYVKNITDKYKGTKKAESSSVAVTDEMRRVMEDNSKALLTKTCSVQFIPNNYEVFTDEAKAKEVLDEFVKVAKILNGTLIHITGHVSSQNTTATQMKLSEDRANFIKDYLISNGIDEKRIIAEGKGGYEPIFAVPQNSAEHEANRRVTASFYTDIEGE